MAAPPATRARHRAPGQRWPPLLLVGVILVLVGSLTPRVLAHDGDETASLEGSTGRAADVGAVPSDGPAPVAGGGGSGSGDLAAEEDAMQLPMPAVADRSPADRPEDRRAGAAHGAGRPWA